MIRRIQVLNYRCLRYVDVALDRFQLLAGGTGTGKSSLLDAIAFLSDLMRHGLQAAVAARTGDFRDLVWGRPEDNPCFEVAVEFELPSDLSQELGESTDFPRFRYEIAVADRGDGAVIDNERGILLPSAPRRAVAQQSLFSDPPPAAIPSAGHRRGSKTVFSKSARNDSFNVEVAGSGGKGWAVRIALGSRRSTLASLPDAPDSFPASTHIRQTLRQRVTPMALAGSALGGPCPPGRPAPALAADLSNLPWVVRRFRETDPANFDRWIELLRAALPGFGALRVTERESDRYACLSILDSSGTEVPSRTASDGTVRLIALTLIPRLPAPGRIYLACNPEHGLDAKAIRSVYQALSGVSGLQVLASTCSPQLLGCAEPRELLCFVRNAEGATEVAAGHRHPNIEQWSDARDNARLFAPELLD